MSLEKIDKYLPRNNIVGDKSDVLNKIKKTILDTTSVEVKVGIKPPSTMILVCGSASASSELSSQKDQILELINNILIDQKIIDQKITNLVIKQN